MSGAAPKLVMLPGLGADARLLARQRADFPDLIVPEWIAPERRETLAHYSERMAASVRVDGPCVVAGVSLGGMVALEMARHMNARCAVLVSSCREPGAVNGLLRMAEMLTRPVPERVMSWSLVLAPLVLGRGFKFPPMDRRLLLRMVQETPLSFVRWGARAVLEWPGLQDAGVPVRAIHGARDWVISPRRVRAEVMVADGPHVLNVSHPREVNGFLAKVLGEC